MRLNFISDKHQLFLSDNDDRTSLVRVAHGLYLKLVMDFYSALSSSQLDRTKPTIFEVVSCSQLDGLLTPSLKYILAHYTQRNPRLLIRILNNFDELNLLIRGAIEYTYLKTWNATFIEKFYGIKRSSSKPIIPANHSESIQLNKISQLSNGQVFLSLIEAVGVPYALGKIQAYHEKLVPQYIMNTINIEQPHDDDSRENKPLSMKIIQLALKLKKFLRNLFYRYYPYAKLLARAATLLIYISYLSNQTSSISIIQLLSKMSYSRITNADHQRVESIISPQKGTRGPSPNVPPTMSSIVTSNLVSLSQPLRKLAWSTTDTILPISIFLLKFLEWYNTNRANNNKDDDNSNRFSIPKPPSVVPAKLLKSEKGSEKYITISTADHDASKCRICHQQIHNFGIIETGYVFCYKCIYEYLRDQPRETGGVCPVTKRKLLGCSWSGSKREWVVTNLRKVII